MNFHCSLEFAKMFALQINAKNVTVAFMHSIFSQSHLESLKSSQISIRDIFLFLFVFVSYVLIFGIFEDRVFTSLFINL